MGGGRIAHTGRIHAAWGGNSPSTSLQDWLGSITNPMIIDDLELPELIGMRDICSGSSHTYELINTIPGHTISWSVTPSNFFSSPSTGTGAIATLTPINYIARGEITLTFFSQSPISGCNPAVIQTTINVGAPEIERVLVPDCFEPGTHATLFSEILGEGDITWSFPTCPLPNDFPDPDPDCWFNYSGNQPIARVYVGNQKGSISLFASNKCGTSSINIPIEFCQGDNPPGGGGSVIIKSGAPSEDSILNIVSFYPNPTDNNLNVSLNKHIEGSAEVFSFYGKRVLVKSISSNKIKLNLSQLPVGTYVVRISNIDETLTRRIVVN